RNKDFFTFLCQKADLPKPLTLPSWLMKPLAPYATDFFATSMPVSNAKAARELGWKPVVAPTYREGIQHSLDVLKQQNSASSEGPGSPTALPSSFHQP